MGEHSDDDWTPPSAADMKILEARQERSNQISKLMGSYMLKGYGMLDRICHCGCILLQDRQGVEYCVACNELETECAKDDPALSSEAARTAVLESQLSEKAKETARKAQSSGVDRMTLYGITEERRNSPQATSQGRGQSTNQNSETHARGDESTYQNGENVQIVHHINTETGNQLSSTSGELKNQISWATGELKVSTSLETSIQLCNLIKACSEALIAVNNAQKL